MQYVFASSVLLCTLLAAGYDEAADPVFSGPQKGEHLSPFVVRQVLGENAGKDWKPIEAAAGRPLLLIFVHDVTRPALGLTRSLIEFAHKRGGDRMLRAVIILTDDTTDAETYVKRIAHALPQNAERCVSLDGKEGPGALGLNRKVSVTVLLAKGSDVTANFALVQPSIQVDAPKIAQAIASLLGDNSAPTAAELGIQQSSEMNKGVLPDEIRNLVRPLIDKNATESDVVKAAKAIEEKMAKNEAIRIEIARISQTIVRSGKLDNYGTEAAQKYLREWSERLNAKDPKSAAEPKRDDKR